MHLESVKLLVDEFARLVLPLGTTAVVADPHEIANVLGSDGVHWLLDASADLQLDVFFMAPSCVPASPFESPRRAARPRRPRGADAPQPGARAGRDDELPRRRRRPAVGAREARARRAPSTSTATRPGSLGKGLQAYAAAGHPLRPRVPDRRRGPRAAAGRDVAPDPRGVDGAQPRGAPPARARVRPEPDRVLHRRPRPRGHRRERPHQRDGARGGRARRHAGGRARDGVVQPRPVARAPRTSGRSRPGTRPTCSSCPTSSSFVPELVLKRGRPIEDVPSRARAGVGAPDRAGEAGHRRRLRDPLGRRARSARSG